MRVESLVFNVLLLYCRLQNAKADLDKVLPTASVSGIVSDPVPSHRRAELLAKLKAEHAAMEQDVETLRQAHHKNSVPSETPTQVDIRLFGCFHVTLLIISIHLSGTECRNAPADNCRKFSFFFLRV